MAEFSHRVVQHTAYEWHVPAGAAVAEFGKAYSAAKARAEGLGVDTSFDDWAPMDVTDDTVVIRFQHGERVTSG